MSRSITQPFQLLWLDEPDPELLPCGAHDEPFQHQPNMQSVPDPPDPPFAASHSSQRSQVAFTLLVPTLTSWAKGMMATLMSPSFLAAV